MKSQILKYNSLINDHKENEAHLKTIIEKLEEELKWQEERLADARNLEYDALTKLRKSYEKPT